MKLGIIYTATNKINGKRYVGQTIRSLEKRRRGHLSCAFNPNTDMYHSKFYCAIRKYGIQTFVWKVIEKDICFEDLDYAEILAISYFDTFKNGYNSNTGGDSPKEISIETRQKMSLSHKGKVLSEEHKIKISEANKGKTTSEETKKKLSNLNINKKCSEITKKRISESLTGNKNPNFGKHLSEQHKRKLNRTGKYHTEETKKKMSFSSKGKLKSKDHCKNISKGLMGKKHSLESIEKISKTWKIIFPDTTTKIIKNLKQFCRDNKLSFTTMRKVSQGRQEHHKNYKCFKINYLSD